MARHGAAPVRARPFQTAAQIRCGRTLTRPDFHDSHRYRAFGIRRLNSGQKRRNIPEGYSHRVGPMSIQQLLSQSIDPAAFAAIVIKGVHAPVAAYAPVCSQLIRVNTDGVTTADLSRLKYYNRRRPQFPFEKQHAREI